MCVRMSRHVAMSLLPPVQGKHNSTTTPSLCAHCHHACSVLLCIDAEGAAVPLSVYHLSEEALAALQPDRDMLAVIAPCLKEVRLPPRQGGDGDGGGGSGAAAAVVDGDIAYTAVQVLDPEGLLVNGRATTGGGAAQTQLAIAAYDR